MAPTAAPQGLRGTVVAVNLYDERPTVSDDGRLLHMPETTIVGDEDTVYPALDDATRQLIITAVPEHVSPGRQRLEIDVYVTTGKQSFRVEEMREVVEVLFAVRIEVIAAGNASDVRSAEGQEVLSRDGIDVLREEVDTMYVQAVRESVRRGFEGIISARP